MDFDARTQTFVEWFKALPGATFSDGIEVVDLRSRGAGRGIVATRDIEAGTTLFTIPRKAIMSRETSELASRLPDLFAASVSAQQHDEAEDEVPEQKQDSWSALILILMHELLRGEASPWRAYFDVLPTAFDTPMFWGDDELAELQASATRAKVGRESAEAMFRAAVVPVIRRHADLFPGSAGVSDDELIALAHRMGSTIMAYAFDLEGDDDEEEPEGDDEWVEDRQGKSTMGMVPMADILNADAEFNAHVNHGDDSLSVVTVRPIAAGDEVLNYYGPHPNSELLRRYGYVTPLHARHDVVELPWSDVEDALRAEVGVSPDALARVRAALEDDAEFEDTFVLEREPADVGPDGTFGGAAPAPVALPEDLLEQLKTVVKALGKLDAAAAGAVASDKRKRRQTIEAVVARVLVAVEARYPTTAAEDERLLAQGGDLPLRRRMAIVVRLGEKKLLQEAKAQLAASADARDDAPEEGSGKRARRA